ncbi:TIGR03620 family F420-dependent LLM class oxidoreductase [Nocardioides hwasunensis]|uniref:TIGR03620 family F420-dependent LLM class oxidoreductase n=1 Tax=Nocardioides hwasunensis TaxID=397258 RepID=A0ABR8MLG4_9ACTN|nr:TIGR03620 family F420-dependent LLM class oxidoreductase [Nocardioides hwasunensis]MBD3915622.1 TIGR03620 family F420-dependent LLM class oxidoreductase [Nocardioides hwasunensis]
MTLPTGRWGVWSTALRFGERDDVQAAAATLEAAGSTALWMTGGLDDPFDRADDLLQATEACTVATGILSIWTMEPADVARRVAGLSDPARFLLGLGVSHPALVDREDPGRYARPLSRMREHLTGLDRTGVPEVGRGNRVLAALGPRMVELARDHSLGAHPYLTTARHTARARVGLGGGAFLAPTQMVLLETDPSLAREAARGHLAMYLRQPNYVSSWRRLGFTADDVADGGSDRLVDSMVAWGSPAAVAGRLREHLAAGADHVCVQALTTGRAVPVEDLSAVLAELG